jgi:ubiquinone/menaquinone biosynthesis C-methylase UbiE
VSDRGLHAPSGGAVSADAYEEYIGRWSRLFVPSLLAAAAVQPGYRILDVAAGTGEASLAAARLVAPSGAVIATDISAAMLQAACARSAGSLHAVAADGQALPFQDAGFDAVVCQLGLMFFPDPARGLAEFCRVLRPGRRAAICVISTAERAPMWGALAAALGRQLPEMHDTLHLSFSLAERGRLESMLRAAGFEDVTVSPETRSGAVASFDRYWSAIEAGTGQQPLIYASLPEPKQREVREEVRAALTPFLSDGKLMLSVEMLIASGRA